MDLEAEIQTAATVLSDAELRLFACECCRRILKYLESEKALELLAIGEARCRNAIDREQIELARHRPDDYYGAYDPHTEIPSVPELALYAVGEVAFTESALTAAIHATEFAAETVAVDEGLKVADQDYDIIHDPVYAAEQAYQSELLKRFVARAQKL